MRMNVDGLDALALDHHREMPWRGSLGVGGVEQAAAAERDAAGSRAFEKIPACGGHVVSSDFCFSAENWRPVSGRSFFDF
jgi:hypothetical protein